ncbi:MAG: carboxypeptidase regulatory-like domain-containing protein [Gemmatimonadetes bacterium]|nr:hypothetical protein [Gemmatimonadota bacterium]MYA40917.1 carboxypeptidase regulatory-like domain-containing protein [Gemmatimonadota bacterium]MYE93857.1 carboxypeptidase regulatory-like domain-containing protein [Gemmatimonadota bacterium]MYJ11510.1 carboxypeptidase regulatory-like domain-containing protein [Gemmatimonadota bacterium]
MNCHTQQAIGARHWRFPRTALIAFVTGVSLATPTSTRGLEAQESSPQGETIRLTAEIRDSRDNAALLGAVIEFTGLLGRYVTGVDGRTEMDLPRGRYWINVRRWGYERLAGYVEVIRAGELRMEMRRTRGIDVDGSGSLVVRVVDGESGDPIEGAMVSRGEAERRVSDENGQVEFGGLWDHVILFSVELTGYGARTAPVALSPNRTTAVRVEMVAETAAPRPIETEMRSMFMEGNGIHDRMARNSKRTHVLTRPMLDQLAAGKLTDAFRTVPGIRVEGRVSEPPVLVRAQCPLSLYVDGTERHTDRRTRRFFIDDLAPESVELIEIWAPRRDSSCGGSVLIWTR